MAKEITKQEEISPEIINSLILTGDMSKLTPTQSTQYYTAVCKSVGINPLTQPFAIITLQGKKTLYATKGCTQQLSDSRKINTEIRKTETMDGVYLANCRATMPDGRYTDDIGAVSIVGLKGADLANAMMKSITKAKRRAVLALCGLGIPDESEVEDMPQQHVASEDRKPESGKSRVEQMIDNNKDAEDAQTKSMDQKVSKEIVQQEKPKRSNKEDAAVDTGILKTQGVIEGQPKTGTINGEIKYLFKIQDKEYGTFDKAIIEEVLKVIDIQQSLEKKSKKEGHAFGGILIEFEYKERLSTKTAGKMFYDIVSFRQVTADDVEVPV